MKLKPLLNETCIMNFIAHDMLSMSVCSAEIVGSQKYPLSDNMEAISLYTMYMLCLSVIQIIK